MSKTKSAFLLSLGLIWLGLSSATVTADDNATDETPSWLFVQEAASGTLKGPDNQHLTLTLKRVRDYTTAFTDRPFRDAVDFPTQTFVANFATAFAGDPPNASLSYRLPGESRPHTLILELNAPVYDSKKKTVTYQAAVIHEQRRVLGGQANEAIPALIPPRFTSPALMIDRFDECFGQPDCKWDILPKPGDPVIVIPADVDPE